MGRKYWWTSLDSFDNFEVVNAVVRVVSVQHLVVHYTHRPYIAQYSVLLALKHLRCHGHTGAQHRPSHYLVLQNLRESQVSNLRRPIMQQNISQFEVSMYGSDFMQPLRNSIARTLNPLRVCLRNSSASSSLSLPPFFSRYFSKSPPLQYSIIMYTFRVLENEST